MDTVAEDKTNQKTEEDKSNKKTDRKTGEGKPNEVAPIWLSTRLYIVVLGCFGFIQFYASVVNINIAIVCMVNKSSIETGSEAGNSSIGEEFQGKNSEESTTSTGSLGWDTKIQGYVLGAFYWGYLVSQIPAAWLATRYGARRVLGISQLMASVSTLLTPLAANSSYIFLMVLRIFLGILCGTMYPGMHYIMSNWAPPLERSKLTGITYSGMQLALIITFPVGASLCKYGFAGGWPSIFYICGTCTFVWAVAWLLTVSDKPDDHKHIKPQERKYIIASLAEGAHQTSRKDIKVPWLKIAKSMPNYAIIIANVCFDWAVYTFITYIPTYMNDVLKLNIEANGILSAVPYIVFWIVVNLSGWLADLCQQKKLISRTLTRKVFTIIGSVVPASLCIALGYVDSSSLVLAIVLLTLTVSSLGFQYSGYIVNHVDIAPFYAAILFGISNSMASVSGFIVPIIVGEITKEAQTRVEWQIVFYVTASVLLLEAVFYSVFGSGNLQPWAKPTIDIIIKNNEDKHISEINDGFEHINA